MKRIALVFLILMFIFQLVSAVPGIPHQFYGEVSVNGLPAPDNNIITASVEESTYMTVTKDGSYGHSPNIFYIEDPDGNREGRTIFFYVGGKPAGSTIFENNGYNRIDFDLTTTCGDNYCLGDETCGTCQTDCGICTTPPVITIHSPEFKTYDTTNTINLDVSSDQPIIIWMYALDGTNFVTFNPNITLNLNNGNYALKVLGINQVFQIGSNEGSFTINVPYCGNGVCNTGESCSSCSADCGSCSSSSSASGGGGGSSSSSSGGGGGSTSNKSTGDGIVNLNFKTEDENKNSDEKVDEQIKEENFFSKITGAVAGFGKEFTKSGTIVIISFVVVIAIATLIISLKKRKNKNKTPNFIDF